MSDKRNYSADFLRCILMIMIIVHHIVVHAFDLKSIGDIQNTSITYEPYLFFLNAFCVIAVNCFFFISGYFSIKFSLKKTVILFLEMQFYSMIWCVIMIFSGQISTLSMLIKKMIMSVLPVYLYWFMGVYILLCFLSPYINDYVFNLDKNRQMKLLLILSIIATFYGFIFNWSGIGRGYTFLHGLYMYYVGMLCKQNTLSLAPPLNLCKKAIKRSIGINAWIYLILSLIVGGLSFLLFQMKLNKISWIVYSYNNPLLIFSGVSFSLLFVTRNSQNPLMKFFSRISKYTLAAYLITDYDYARIVLFYPLKYILSFTKFQLVKIPIIISYAIILFICCIIIDYGRKILFSILGKFFHLEELYEDICNRFRPTNRT